MTLDKRGISVNKIISWKILRRICMEEITLSSIYNLPGDQLGAMTLLGIEKARVAEDGFSVVMKVKDCHLNTQGTVHGGILYTLCDQAVGAYIVYRKMKGVGMDGSIHYYSPSRTGDLLTATVYERKSGRRIGVYFVELKNQADKRIADGLFTTMYLE